MRYLYTTLLYLSLPILVLRLLLLGLKNKEYIASVLPRFGFIKHRQITNKFLWIHAVSVGEVQAASPLIKYILKEHPSYSLLVTTTTPTGKAHLQRLFGKQVIHEYIPYDIPFAIKSLIRVFNPEKLIVMETEIWPNLYQCVAKSGADVYLINARLSEKSYKGYAKFRPLISDTLNQCKKISAQFEADAERFKQLGVDSNQIVVTGNIKNDINVSEEELIQAKALKEKWQDKRLLWIAASTHEGEEGEVLNAHQKLLQHEPNALLILVPRHPERSGKIIQSINDLSLNLISSSQLDNSEFDSSTQVLLVDELGVLMTYFGTADIAFVGGSLIPHGGHNLLEPACHGLPILSGMNLHNFQQISELLLENESLIIVHDADDIFQQLKEFLLSKEKFLTMGARAKQSYLKNRGSMQTIIKLLNLNQRN